MPVGGDMGTRLLILGGEVFNLGKNLFTSGAKFEQWRRIRGVFVG